MEIKLMSMTDSDYEEFFNLATDNYGQEKTKSGGFKPEEAKSKAEDAFKKLLPQKQNTKDHILRKIVYEGKNIGFIWYYIDWEEKEAFLYEIYIEATYRSRGFGRLAMEKVLEEIKVENLDKMSLHVFGHNERALGFYRDLGFSITDYNLSLLVNKEHQ